MNQLVNISAERQAEAVVLNELEIEELALQKTEQILTDFNIKRPTARMYPELARKIHDQGQGEEEERSTNMEYQIFDGESQEQKRRQEKANRKKVSKSKKIMEKRRKWCWGRCGPRVGARGDGGQNNS